MKIISENILKSWRCEVINDDPPAFSITTDALLPNNDCIELIIEKCGNNFVIHDMAETYNYLYLLGIDLASSPQKQRLDEFHNILKNIEADFIDFEIRKEAKADELAMTIGLLTNAIKEISSIAQFNLRPTERHNFKEKVYAFFVARKTNVSLNYEVAGILKKHIFDIRLNGRDEILGKTISAKSPSKIQMLIERAWYSFNDVQSTQKTFEPAIFYDDVQKERLSAWRAGHFEQLNKLNITYYGFMKDRKNLEELAKKHRKLS